MEFRILGPLEVMADTQLIDTGSPRERIILSILLLDMGRVVPVERLIDAVWDDAPPRTARTQIQICVSSLRRRFLPVSRSPTIVTRHPGYAIVPHEWRLDAEVFEERVAAAQAAVDDGDHAGAAQTLRSALAMWRGEPLAGVDSRLVQASAVRIRDRQLLVTEDWAELELELGHHESIIGTHSELVLAHPYRERLHEQLMLALHRSGRSADALEVFRSIRAVLAEELGLLPGERLRRLERAILNNEAGGPPVSATRLRPTRVVPGPKPHQLPADVVDFTGQTELIADVEKALIFPETAPEQRPRGMRIVALAGASGTGKTACAIHVAHRIAHRFPDGQLYADLRGDQPSPADPARILERFVVALGVPSTAVSVDVDERLDLYRSLVADRRMLIVLDNAASESQLLPLLPGSSTCAVLITAQRRITGLPGIKVNGVKAFDADTAVAFLAKVAGADRVHRELAAARQLAGWCDGLPLALRVAGARLAARPHWTITEFARRLASERHRLDELGHEHLNVRAALSSMLDRLAPGPLRLILALGLLDTLEFPGWAAAALLDLPMNQAQEYLEVLTDVQLVHITGDTAEGKRYRMSSLIRALARERYEVGVPAGNRAETVARVLSGWLPRADLVHLAALPDRKPIESLPAHGAGVAP
jgi:DNA-binding SARP family transcriptional activator